MTNPGTLVLLRHGESEWNKANLFTGWVDVPLSEKGRVEAARGGQLLAEHGLLPDVLHTSVLKRAIATAELALAEADRQWIPVTRSLAAQRAALRRAAGQGQGRHPRRVRRGAVHALAPLVRHPAAARSSPAASSPRTATRATRSSRRRPARRPSASRTSSSGCCPTGTTRSCRTCGTGQTVLVAAHGNSLRALVKHLDGMGDDEVVGLNIPTGVPLRYDLDDDLRPLKTGGEYLDPDAAAAAIEAVKNQGKK